MADETGVEDIFKAFYGLMGAVFDRAESTLDTVGKGVKAGSIVPGLAPAADLVRSISAGK